MEITYGLMIVIGLVTFLAWSKPALLKKLQLNPYSVVKYRQYHRLLTSGFVHNDKVHLGLNLFTLYFFGTAIEVRFLEDFGQSGPYLYILLFITAVVIANIPTTLKYKDAAYYNSLGASGAVSALVLAFILFKPLDELCMYGVLCLPGYALGGLFIAYSIFMSNKNMDNINHDAHLFGALYGVIFILALRPDTMNKFLETLF